MSGVKIISVCGRKRHGKDSIGQVLAGQFGFRVIAFADPIKHAVMDWYGFSYEQVYGDLKEVVDSRWGITPRHAMQVLGTEAGRLIHKNTWVRKCLTTIRAAEAGQPVVLIDHELKRFREFQWNPGEAGSWVICDCRFPDESEAIKAQGGKVVKVIRPGLGESTDQHASETSVDQVVEDYLIINDGTLAELSQHVRNLSFLGGP